MKIENTEVVDSEEVEVIMEEKEKEECKDSL